MKSEMISQMMEVARGCGQIIRKASEERIGADIKSSFRDLVTKYDVQVQNYAIGQLSERFPGAGFIGEESGEYEQAESALTFVIDPIDGTANFVHHYQHSCTSIGCIRDGKPLAAVVYDPFLDEMFRAEKGQGAYLNDRRLRMEDLPLSEGLVLFGSAPYNPELTEETFRNLRSLFGKCQDVRQSGSAALDLCYVAAGRAALFFESILSVWDYAAGALIVEEAGGRCTAFGGNTLVFDRPVKSSVLAGTPASVAESGLL